MKNLNFKNFNYAMIDSARSGYREILVTYTVEGKTVRKCLFIKEVKGKDKNYYLAQAKKEINASIKDGSLAKSASRQLSRGTKPALITISAVLAAGALGTGGYFLGNYLGGGGGPTPSPVTSGYTVVLYAGEFDGSSGKASGKFADGNTYLIFNNVAEGTHVDQIEGYVLPTCGDYDFSHWATEIEGPHDVINSDIVLTANYREGIGYYKAIAKQRMLAYAKEMKDLVDEGSEFKEAYDAAIDEICNVTTNAIETSKQIVDDNKSVEVVNELTDFAISTMDTVYDAGPQSFMSILEYYKKDIKDVTEATSPAQSLALTKVCTAYLGSLADSTSVKNNNLDAAFDLVKKRLADSTLTETQLSLLTYAGSGCVGGAAYTAYPSEELQKIITEKLDLTLKYAGIIEKTGGVSDSSINWFGEYLQNYYKTQSKYVTNPEYTKFLTSSDFAVDNYITAILKPSSDTNLTILNIKASMIKGLADIAIAKLPDFDTFNTTVAYALTSITTNISRVALRMESYPAILAETLTKSSDCFNKAMEAFVLVPEQLPFLFGSSKMAQGSILGQLNTLLPLIPEELSNGNFIYKFLDVYEAALDSAVKIAENRCYGPDFDMATTYETVYDNLLNSVYCMFGSSKLYTDFYNQGEAIDCLTDIFSTVMELIPGSHDFRFYMDAKDPEKNRMETIINLYNPNNKNVEDQPLYLDSTVSRTTYAKIVTSSMRAGIKFFIDYEMKDYGESASMFINDMIDMLWYDGELSIALNNMAKANPVAASLMGDLVCETISKYVFTVYENAKDFATPELFPLYIKEVATSIYSTARRMAIEFSSAPIQMYNSFVEIVDEFFTTLPLLKREDSAEMTYYVLSELFGVNKEIPTNASLLYCYAFYISCGEKVKAAIEEKYIKNVTDHMTMDELKKIVEDTKTSLREIIYKQ